MEYRLALILPQSRQLLTNTEFNVVCLPSISIPASHRPAEYLTKVIEDMWQMKTIVLDILTDISAPSRCAIIEVRNTSSRLGDYGLQAINIDDIHQEAFLSPTEQSSVRRILTNDSSLPMFLRLGWVDEAQRWITSACSTRRISFTDEIDQVNAGGAFALIRFGTSEGASCWLKATGEPNTREFTITTQLSRWYPDFLPPLLTARSDWNAWVTEEVGTNLPTAVSTSTIMQVAIALADLQKQTIGNTDALFCIGCQDQRTHNLRESVDEVFLYLQKITPLQVDTRVKSLSREELGLLERSVRLTCDEMDELHIPDTIANIDMKPANILSDGHRCVFTDWCHAYVGNPFITFQHLHTYLLKTSHETAEALAVAYGLSWHTHLSNTQIRRAMALSPLLATFAYLSSAFKSLDANRRDASPIQGYCRSLARQMKRAADTPRDSEVLCH
jgi:hypothetical protein